MDFKNEITMYLNMPMRILKNIAANFMRYTGSWINIQQDFDSIVPDDWTWFDVPEKVQKEILIELYGEEEFNKRERMISF